MTDLSFYLILFDAVNGVSKALLFSVLVLLVAFVIGTVISIVERNKLFPHSGKAVVFFMISIALLSAVPSSKTFYTVLAIETGVRVAEQPEVKELLGDGYKLLQKKIQEELGE